MHLKLIAKARKEMNKEGIKFADGGMMADGGALDLLADTSGATSYDIGGTSFSTVDLTSHLDFNANPMFAHGGELHRGEMMAKGGMIEHGLEVGDVIKKAQGYYIYVSNNNKKYLVDLNKGARIEIQG